MDKDFTDLIKKFNEIKNKGLIDCESKLKNAAGLKLEELVGGSGHDFCFPDYNGIELKSIRDYPDATIDLFSITPVSNHLLTMKWLSNKYGYPDKTFQYKKSLKGEVYSNVPNQIGMNYLFQIKINEENNKIFLQIFNKKGELLNEDVYWFIDEIKQKLELKLTKLALITHKRYSQNKKYYFTYDNIKLYKLKSFDIFLEMIKKGIVSITFKTGYYKSGKYVGKFHDHGTSFRILKKDLDYIFNRIY